MVQQTPAEAFCGPAECADRMIELALKGGGTDNVTQIVADVVDVDFGDRPIVGGAAGDGPTRDRRSTAARARVLTAPPLHRILHNRAAGTPPTLLPNDVSGSASRLAGLARVSCGASPPGTAG